MKSKQTLFISFIIGIVIIILGIGFFVNRAQAPSKYDDFAKALKDRGAKFYGAFWCTHCQAQKAEFGSAKKYLPYVECSKPNNTLNQICIDNKIESFPTWTFKDGVSLNSKSDPVICKPSPGIAGEPDICKQISSKNDSTWIFEGYRFSVKSDLAPVKNGDVWSFPSGAKVTGEVPLEFLAEQINFTLPE